MQRRTVPSAKPASITTQAGSVPTTSPSRIGIKGRNKNSKKFNPILILITTLTVLIVIVWTFFPAQFNKVEKEAENVGQDIAEKAIKAEHDMEDWWRKRQRGDEVGATSERQSPDEQAEQIRIQERIEASKAATARMEAQSSKWVNGEKKLKEKLQVLYDRQLQGLDLGVPVLTRYLGEDIPAYVTPDMNIDVNEWKKQVDAKYAEMRLEEEEWQKKMWKIIEQRERDIGITTP